MKITYTILALLTAGLLSHSAFGDNDSSSSSLGFAVTQDGHGQSHFLYYQSSGLAYPNIVAPASIALTTSSGGVDNSTVVLQPSDAVGGVKYVIGTNQHGESMAAFVPVNSHFAPAGQ